LQRELLVRQKKTLHSTPAGQALVAALPKDICSPALTALWEQSLESIADGELSGKAFVEQQVVWLQKLLQRETPTLAAPGPRHSCPQCQKPLRRRKGAKGAFWGCTGYPDCGYTAPDNRGKPGKPKPKTPAKTTDIPCPSCGGQLRQRQGKRGAFWGCANYPDCNFTAPDRQDRPELGG